MSELQPVLSQINDTFSEMWTLFENDTQQIDTLDSAGMLRTASVLFCQRDLLLNDTTDRKKEYLDRLRPVSEQTSVPSADQSSAYVYENSTSELIFLLLSI